MLHPLSVSTIGLCMKQHLGRPQHRQSTKLFYCCLQLSNTKSNMIATGCKKSFHHPIARNKKCQFTLVLELLGGAWNGQVGSWDLRILRDSHSKLPQAFQAEHHFPHIFWPFKVGVNPPFAIGFQIEIDQ